MVFKPSLMVSCVCSLQKQIVDVLKNDVCPLFGQSKTEVSIPAVDSDSKAVVTCEIKLLQPSSTSD